MIRPVLAALALLSSSDALAAAWRPGFRPARPAIVGELRMFARYAQGRGLESSLPQLRQLSGLSPDNGHFLELAGPLAAALPEGFEAQLQAAREPGRGEAAIAAIETLRGALAASIPAVQTVARERIDALKGRHRSGELSLKDMQLEYNTISWLSLYGGAVEEEVRGLLGYMEEAKQRSLMDAAREIAATLQEERETHPATFPSRPAQTLHPSLDDRLKQAVFTQDFALVQQLVRDGHPVSIAADDRNTSLPSVAILTFNEYMHDVKDAAKILHYLIGHGAPFDAPDIFGMTSLHHAVGEFALAFANILLDAGASTRARTAEIDGAPGLDAHELAIAKSYRLAADTRAVLDRLARLRDGSAPRDAESLEKLSRILGTRVAFHGAVVLNLGAGGEETEDAAAPKGPTVH